MANVLMIDQKILQRNVSGGAYLLLDVYHAAESSVLEAEQE